jgi:hypothetical protein
MAVACHKTECLRFRSRHVPESTKIIFVLESPPASGRYFYNPDGAVTEPLFRAMMKDVLELAPASKEEGLSRFREQGYFLTRPSGGILTFAKVPGL